MNGTLVRINRRYTVPVLKKKDFARVIPGRRNNRPVFGPSITTIAYPDVYFNYAFNLIEEFA